MKTCSKCHISKRLSDFKKHSWSKDGLYSQCKQCVRDHRHTPEERKKSNAYQRLRRKRPHARRYYKKYRKKYCQTERGRDVISSYFWKRHYGITIEQYREMFDTQKGCCAICERHQSLFKKRLAVDHDHESGKIRALLCKSCNIALGEFQEEISLLEKAIEYLLKHKPKLQVIAGGGT